MRKKIIIYNTLKSLLILLASIYFHSKLDISSILSFIPSNNVSLNISVYVTIISLFWNLFEEFFTSQHLKVDVIVSPNKHDTKEIFRTLSLNSNRNSPVYIIISTSGNLKRIENRKLKVIFPRAVTASRQDNKGLANQLENVITIDSSELSDLPGKTTISIDIIQNDMKIEQSKEVKCILVQEQIWDPLFISYTSNSMRIETET